MFDSQNPCMYTIYVYLCLCLANAVYIRHVNLVRIGQGCGIENMNKVTTAFVQ